jgi:hypothetical protein
MGASTSLSLSAELIPEPKVGLRHGLYLMAVSSKAAHG